MAARIPQEFIDELLARVDIVDIIDGRVPLKKAGKEYKACCPFHDERTPSFTVSPDKQFYHCFGCGAHGTAISFLMDYEHMEFPEAIEHLAARLGMVIPTGASEPADRTKNLDLLTVVNEADQFYRYQLRKHPKAESAILYLKNRGLTGDTAAQFGLGYAPEGWNNLLRALGAEDRRRHLLFVAGLLIKKDDGSFYDRFRNRIVFPIHDHRGRVVGFGGRAIGDEEPKYLNSPETPLFHKGSELYGLYRARGTIKEKQHAVVVEGYMDVVSLAQHGIQNAVATLGTATTRAHLERLFRYCPDITFCFDGDRAGLDAAWRALQTSLPVLHEGRQVSFLFLPEGHDPDSLVRVEGDAGFAQRLAGATPLPDYFLQRLCDGVDLKRLDGRARLIELARPLIKQIPPGALHALLLDRLADLAQIQRASLFTVFTDQREETARPKSAKPAGGKPPARTSLVRVALALLIQHPRLARIAGEVEALRGLGAVPGVDLLATVVQMITEHPGLSTAALLERFRATDHAKHLEKLAMWDHMIGEEHVESEFRAILARLHSRLRSQEAELLLDKSRGRALTPQEKAQLKALLTRSST